MIRSRYMAGRWRAQQALRDAGGTEAAPYGAYSRSIGMRRLYGNKRTTRRSMYPRKGVSFSAMKSSPRSPVELKFYDVNSSRLIGSGGSATASSFNPLVADVAGDQLSQGTGNSERIGQRIMGRSLMVRAHVRTVVRQFASNLSALSFARVIPVRLFIVLDKQANGTLAPIQDILVPNGFASADFSSAFPLLRNSQRFVILRSKLVHIPCQVVVDINGNTVGFASYQFEETVKFNKGLLVTIDGPNGDVSEFTSNQLLVWCALPVEYNTPHAPPVTKWAVEFESRFRYTDF